MQPSRGVYTNGRAKRSQAYTALGQISYIIFIGCYFSLATSQSYLPSTIIFIFRHSCCK